MSMLEVVPVNDERRHRKGDTCWCGPEVQWLDPETRMPWAAGGPLVIHNSMDCREVVENLIGENLAPNKGWRMVVR